MELKNKNVLLIGLAKTGVSTIKTLSELGAKVSVNDIKKEEDLTDILYELKEIKNISYILGYHPENISDFDLVVVSPGVPLDLPFILKIKESNTELIGEVELAYRLNNSPLFIALTGTNGKTTTTSLTYEIFKKENKDCYKVGNIGNPVIDTVKSTNKDSILITELSSFQLESIKEFRPKISAILNFSEDHLNRHKTMQNYIDAKCNVYLNQDENDFCVLNYDDEVVRNLESKIKSKVLFFSTREKLEKGIYLEDDNIVINLDQKTVLINKNEVRLCGEHNLQNILASTLISYICGISLDSIKYTLKNFSGVEHRQEFVKEVNGIEFINDSKATNPDSSIKAVNSYNKEIVLILGGMDKESQFDELLDNCMGKVSSLVLLGETKEKIKGEATKKGFESIFVVNSMEEAVKTSYKVAKNGQIVLLSPSCASWDMYKNFEVRGNDFKENVYNLR
ncbi:MAG: UDP-N-acetylmuramoyl-L-alanine--D-glutamate ligase [Peptostreptococcaceae bacterium]